jgi:hypothetical protein
MSIYALLFYPGFILIVSHLRMVLQRDHRPFEFQRSAPAPPAAPSASYQAPSSTQPSIRGQARDTYWGD